MWGRMFSRPVCGGARFGALLPRDGTPNALTPDIDGASFFRAAADKEATYPELPRQRQYGELMVLGCETGSRWHHRALTMVSKLIEANTQAIAPLLRQTAALASHVSSMMVGNPFDGTPMYSCCSLLGHTAWRLATDCDGDPGGRSPSTAERLGESGGPDATVLTLAR